MVNEKIKENFSEICQILNFCANTEPNFSKFAFAVECKLEQSKFKSVITKKMIGQFYNNFKKFGYALSLKDLELYHKELI